MKLLLLLLLACRHPRGPPSALLGERVLHFRRFLFRTRVFLLCVRVLVASRIRNVVVEIHLLVHPQVFILDPEILLFLCGARELCLFELGIVFLLLLLQHTTLHHALFIESVLHRHVVGDVSSNVSRDIARNVARDFSFRNIIVEISLFRRLRILLLVHSLSTLLLRLGELLLSLHVQHTALAPLDLLLLPAL